MPYSYFFSIVHAIEFARGGIKICHPVLSEWVQPITAESHIHYNNQINKNITYKHKLWKPMFPKAIHLTSFAHNLHKVLLLTLLFQFLCVMS